MGQFLIANVSQVCELCVSMDMLVVNQIHIDKPQRAEIGPEST